MFFFLREQHINIFYFIPKNILPYVTCKFEFMFFLVLRDSIYILNSALFLYFHNILQTFIKQEWAQFLKFNVGSL